MKRLLLLSLCLAGCGIDHSTYREEGGNGTSTDNVLTSRLRVDSLLTVVKADSLLRDLGVDDYDPYPLLVRLDSSTLDLGHASPDGREFRIFLDEDIPLPFSLREWNTSSKHASAWVRLPNSRLSRWHRLRLSIDVRDSAVRTEPTATWVGIPEAVRQRATSITLANFTRDSLVLNSACHCHTWYTGQSRSGLLGSSTGLENAGRGRTGKAFHLSYTVSGGDWALVGARISPVPLRLSGLDSVTFWARGNGNLRFALEDGRDSTGFAKAWKSIPLDTAWKRYRLLPGDFDSTDSWSLGWKSVRDRITTVSFFSHNSGTDFWIDDIRLHGIAPVEIP